MCVHMCLSVCRLCQWKLVQMSVCAIVYCCVCVHVHVYVCMLDNIIICTFVFIYYGHI